MKTLKKLGCTLGITLFWLAVWQAAAMAVNNQLILPTPLATLMRLFTLAAKKEFWSCSALSVLRVFIGIAAAIPSACLFSVLCSKSRLVKALFSPAVTLMRSAPVVSFILIAIFILERQAIPSVITFIMVFPLLFENLCAGIAQASAELLEMARIFDASCFTKLLRIYLPAVRPFFLSAVSNSVGLAVKAGIAAEVVAYIPQSIGKELSDAKSYMEPADLLAWTVVIILISLSAEKATRLPSLIAERRARDASNKQHFQEL